MEQNLCPNCNKPVLDTEEICPNCGAIIGARQARRQLTKNAIQSTPQNMMASSPRKRKPQGRQVSSRAQTDITPGAPRRKRPPQGRQGQGGQRPQGQRPRRPSGQYMHSAPDSRYTDGLQRPTRGQMIEKKTDITTILVIAGFVIAVIVIAVAMWGGTKAEGGLEIPNENGEVVSDEEVNPVLQLFSPDYKNYPEKFEIILRTNGVISNSQIDEAIKYYQEVLLNKEEAIRLVGNETEFNNWQQNGAHVRMVFTRKTDTKFVDYHEDTFTVPY